MELNKYTVYLYDHDEGDYYFRQVQAENEYEALIEGVRAEVLSWAEEQISREEALLIMHDRGGDVGHGREWNYNMAVLSGWQEHLPAHKLHAEHSIFVKISNAQTQKETATAAYDNMHKLLEPVLKLGLAAPEGLQSLTDSCQSALLKATQDVEKLTRERDEIVIAAKAAKQAREDAKVKEVVGDDAITKQRSLARK